MKKLSTLLLLTCTCIAAVQAQTSTERLKTQLQLVKMLNAVSAGSAGKTTAIEQRLIGSSTIDHQFQVTDSMMYRYSSGRGSDFDMDNLSFSDKIQYPSLAAAQIVMCDSSYEVMHGTQQTATVYDASNLPQRQTVYAGSIRYRHNWTYNAQNKIVEILMETYDSGNMLWVPGNLRLFVYDGQGRLAADTTKSYIVGNWMAISYTEYHYAASGLLDTMVYYYGSSGNWLPDARTTITYTGTQITGTVAELHNGMTWENWIKMDMVYAANRKVSELRYEWISNAWSLVAEEYRHLNANNLPDSVFARELFTTWDTTISKLVFNSFENPVTIDYYDGSMNFMEHERFTYQDYDPQGVKEMAVAKTLSVYPNPARGQLYIATKEMKAGRVDYTITNSLGQAVMSGRDMVSGDKMNIDISQLSSGMYWLQIQSEYDELYRAGIAVE